MSSSAKSPATTTALRWWRSASSSSGDAAELFHQAAREPFPLGVRIGEGADLHLLRGLGEAHLIAVGDAQELLVELGRGVDRIGDLRGRAPAHAGPLLE